MTDGHRESAQSWSELLLDVKRRGLTIDPKLAVGDGALGFWKALPTVFPTTKEQRCWVHKTANILDKLPKNKQPGAKEMIHQIWMADTRENATQACDAFLETYQAKYPKACECLAKDRDELLVFYDFPAEHWKRTDHSPIDTFATVRHRTINRRAVCRTRPRSRGLQTGRGRAESWRRLDGHNQLPKLILNCDIHRPGSSHRQAD